MAASELELVAASAEAQADLWRQAAEHLRRGQINDHYRRRLEVGRLLGSMSCELVDQLVKSIQTHDPELWRREREESAKTSDTNSDALETLAMLHAAVCRHGPDCPVLRTIRDRIRRA